MKDQDKDQPTPDVRAAMGRGGMRPGRIEKASNPRRALTRLAMYLSPYKATLARFIQPSTLVGHCLYFR